MNIVPQNLANPSRKLYRSFSGRLYRIILVLPDLSSFGSFLVIAALLSLSPLANKENRCVNQHVYIFST